ncbi:hypothetical protein V8V91_23390 [Algoriphagus halophilus]|uniref:hypothetical protein n=1 Tax=Algoriphagus halophilus TaxID=226505 RepID=UPI00358F7692
MKNLKITFTCCVMLLALSLEGMAQDYKTEHVVLITLDGMRWQEVFKGADSLLVDDTGMIESPGSLLKDFWDTDPLKRREMLLPFFGIP